MYDSPYYQIRKVDGTRHQLYAQCLSLFAKLFLDSKSIFFSVENFDYYLLTISVANIRVLDEFARNASPPSMEQQNQQNQHKPQQPSTVPLANHHTDASLKSVIESESVLSAQRVIGFFSKEKVSWDNYNLACITVFPPFQKRGLGHLLISYSYYLSKKARLVGTPERPLSEHGAASYLAYWCSTIAQYIVNRSHPVTVEIEEGEEAEEQKHEKRELRGENRSSNSEIAATISIQDISDATYIWQPDVVQALQSMGVLEKRQLKLTGGRKQSAVVGADTDTTNSKYVISLDNIEKWLEVRKKKTQGPALIEGYCLVRKRSKIPK